MKDAQHSIGETFVSDLRRLRARVSQTGIREPFVWFRHRDIWPADVFIAAYPRSGSTWMRFTVYEALTGNASEFGLVNNSVRGIGEHFHAPRLLPEAGRLIGTHERYRLEYHRAIYLVRDIRDVALSQFARECEKGVAPSNFDEYLLGLLTGRKRHGSWQEHVLSWLDSGLEPKNLLVVHFEDLRSNSEQMYAKIMDFLGASRDKATLRKAIQNNSVEQMRAKEDRLYANAANIVRRPVRRSRSEEGRFVRQGLVGAWRERLTESQKHLIDRYAGQALLRMGYGLSSDMRDMNVAIN